MHLPHSKQYWFDNRENPRKNTNGFEIDQDYHEDRLAVDYSIKSINGCKKLGVSRVNKITVLQVYKFYLPHIGGIEKIIQLIAEYSKK